MTFNKKLPIISNNQQVAQSRLFKIEQIDLTFSNGEKRQYERMLGSGRGAVMIVPMLDDETMLLVREYCAGTHSYELGFPKGNAKRQVDAVLTVISENVSVIPKLGRKVGKVY